MKKIIYIIAITFVIFQTAVYAQDSFVMKLDSLVRQKEFFKLRNMINSLPSGNNFTKEESLFISSLLKANFEFPKSMNDVNSFVSEVLNSDFPASLKAKVFKYTYDYALNSSYYFFDFNSVNLYNEKLFPPAKSEFDAEELEDNENYLKILQSLTNLTPPSVKILKDEQIDYYLDVAKLINLPVDFNGDYQNFIFDTGANLPVIVSSLAAKHKMKLFETDIKVGTITDIKVKSKVAICDSLKIGNVVFYNTAFLVLPDESLTFANGFYKINGIIGLPQMRLLSAITIERDDSKMIFHKEHSSKKLNNLAFDGLTPVFMLTQNSDTLTFTFDTGAQKTLLYKKYFDKYKNNIIGKYTETDIEVGGAGGSQKVKGYILDKINLSFETLPIEINDVRLLSESMKKKDSLFFGNLGLDMMWQFKEITINFANMSINFTK